MCLLIVQTLSLKIYFYFVVNVGYLEVSEVRLFSLFSAGIFNIKRPNFLKKRGRFTSWLIDGSTCGGCSYD